MYFPSSPIKSIPRLRALKISNVTLRPVCLPATAHVTHCYQEQRKHDRHTQPLLITVYISRRLKHQSRSVGTHPTQMFILVPIVPHISKACERMIRLCNGPLRAISLYGNTFQRKKGFITGMYAHYALAQHQHAEHKADTKGTWLR